MSRSAALANERMIPYSMELEPGGGTIIATPFMPLWARGEGKELLQRRLELLLAAGFYPAGDGHVDRL